MQQLGHDGSVGCHSLCPAESLMHRLGPTCSQGEESSPFLGVIRFVSPLHHATAKLLWKQFILPNLAPLQCPCPASTLPLLELAENLCKRS